MKANPSTFKISPENEISFNYLPKKYLNSSIRLTSTTDQLLAFKIKTNVPICYLVKPHIGFILPHASIDIAVTMQPTDYNPQTASISDKFLINIAQLSPNIDTATLNDPTRFQQIWESVPKPLMQSHKLKVTLKFETSSSSTNLSAKTDEDTARLSSTSINTQPVNPADISMNDSAVNPNRGTMMHSFINDKSSVGIGRTPSYEQNVLPSSLSEQALNTGQKQSVMFQNREDDRNKKRELATITEEKTEDVNTKPTKTFMDRAEQLEKRIDEMENEKRVLHQKCQELTARGEEQRRMLFELSEENTRLKSELSNLKTSTFKGKPTIKGQGDVGGYQMWHVLLASVLAMIMGAYLSS